jgi:hypothetical protein
MSSTLVSADRARRVRITCSCCGQPGENRGHGWCVACYARWVYWGRPAEGPPLPGTVRAADEVDEIAVVRAISGNPPQELTRAERDAAVVRLRSWGLTYKVIGERVGCSLHTAKSISGRLGTRNIAAARAWIESSTLEVGA